MTTRPIYGTATQPHRVSQGEEPQFFSSTRKTMGIAGAIFFALGALVMDPILLIPAAICAALAFDMNCLDLFSRVCSALTSSREANRSFPMGTTQFPVTNLSPAYGAGGSAQAILLPHNSPVVQLPSSTTLHTGRGGTYVAVPNPQPQPQPYQTQYGLSDVGLQRPPTPLPPQGFNTSSHQSRRTVDDATSLGTRVHRGQGTTVPQGPTSPPVQRDAHGVALPPTLHIGRGGNVTVEQRL